MVAPAAAPAGAADAFVPEYNALAEFRREGVVPWIFFTLWLDPAPVTRYRLLELCRSAPLYLASTGTPGSRFVGRMTSDDFTLATFFAAVRVLVTNAWNPDRSFATHFSRKSTSPDSM